MMLIGERQWLRKVPRKLRLKILVANIIGYLCLLAVVPYYILNRFASYKIDPIVLSFLAIIMSSSALFIQSIHRKAKR